MEIPPPSVEEAGGCWLLRVPPKSLLECHPAGSRRKPQWSLLRPSEGFRVGMEVSDAPIPGKTMKFCRMVEAPGMEGDSIH